MTKEVNCTTKVLRLSTGHFSKDAIEFLKEQETFVDTQFFSGYLITLPILEVDTVPVDIFDAMCLAIQRDCGAILIGDAEPRVPTLEWYDNPKEAL